ncbi:MAG TPA: hypothetical protein VKA31_11550 [Mariprofundaceae bacterium]|nr:hypothetical protein [Mariprofundaceae bacterium]
MNDHANDKTRSCCGVLNGMDNTFTGMLMIPENIRTGNPAGSIALHERLQDFYRPDRPLIACFTSSQGDSEDAQTKQASLCQWLAAQHLPEPQLYAVLEMTHKGRLEIHCYRDATHVEEIPLSMLEDGTLYQQTSNY